MIKRISIIIMVTLIILLIPMNECTAWADDNTSQIKGKFGRQITYKYDQITKTLTISGKGELYNSGSIAFDDEILSVKHIRFENYSASTIPLFKELKSLEDIVIPDSVTSFFPNDEFSGCDNLQRVVLPESIEYLGESAFEYCTCLKSIEIPDSVQYLPEALFYGCTSLENVVLPEGPTELNCWFFGNCSALKHVTLPSTIKTVTDNVFHGCIGLESISFPNGVEKISHQNFDGCINLKEVLIPASVSQIDSDNFDYLDNFVIVGAKGSYAQEFANNNVIPFVIHEHMTFSDEKITKEATCTEEGSEEKVCTACGEKVVGTIEAKGHSWNTEPTVDKAATCTEKGSHSIHCLICNEVKEGSERAIPATGHTYGDWTITKEPTYTSEGTRERVCTVCGNKETEPIPKLDVQSIESASVSGIADQAFSGKAITPSPVVKVGNTTLKEGTDYTVLYSNNTKVGVAKVTITGKGGYTGTITKTFRIQFKDVTDKGLFYYDPIYWAVDGGITTGFDDGSFKPMNGCNRAAVVTFLWRMAGKPNPTKTASFKDMTGNSDFDKAISWASEKGIVQGWNDNTFRPWNTCNRAAIVTFLWRYAGKPSVSSKAGFKDMTGNSEFDKAIAWAASKGITTGWDDGTFRPWNTCNRLAIVSFLNRYGK